MPATRQLLQKEIKTILNKLKIILPDIPDAEYKSSQTVKLSEIEEKYEKCKTDSDELKRLLMHTKSNVFNIHLKYPSLKPLYDQAASEQDQSKEDPFKAKNNTEALKNLAEWKRKRLEKLESSEHEEREEDEEENTRLKTEFILKLKNTQKSIDKGTDEFIKHAQDAIKTFKGDELRNPDGSFKNPKPLKENYEWVEREDNKELKEAFDEADDMWVKSLKKNYGVDITKEELQKDTKMFSGIEGSGTYVMRDGKLVKGEGRKREEVMFSNWYCSNADPEDLRRHRELMDRFTYKGPQWDGVGVPKSIIEEENPVYRKVDPEAHPADNPETAELEGKKEFEKIVR